MAITHRKTGIVSTAVAKAGGIQTGLIWTIDDGVLTKESNDQFLVGDTCNLDVGPALAGARSAARVPSKAVNNRADNTGV